MSVPRAPDQLCLAAIAVTTLSMAARTAAGTGVAVGHEGGEQQADDGTAPHRPAVRLGVHQAADPYDGPPHS